MEDKMGKMFSMHTIYNSEKRIVQALFKLQGRGTVTTWQHLFLNHDHESFDLHCAHKIFNITGNMLDTSNYKFICKIQSNITF
jgi:hypothetical protein